MTSRAPVIWLKTPIWCRCHWKCCSSKSFVACKWRRISSKCYPVILAFKFLFNLPPFIFLTLFTVEERLLKWLQINNWNILLLLVPTPSPQVPFPPFPILVVYLLFFFTSFFYSSPPYLLKKKVRRTKLVCLGNGLIERKLAKVERWLLAFCVSK